MGKKSLGELFLKYEAKKHKEYHGDKGSTHSYLEVYELLFERYRDRPINLLEVGVAAGLSLRMWKDYFNANSLIAGCDPNDKWMSEDLKELFSIAIKFSHAPTTRTTLSTIADQKGYDIIIDDGNHDPAVQCATFWNLFPLLRSGGTYVIEDIPSIDAWKNDYETLDSTCQIYDLREQKGRGDDVLAVYTK